ncbi:TRAP transporter large permease [Dysosmobacter sp.]|jgi:C4-dicarboxylate transporter DctM subunit|uniref:TRAP transporter large permease n=1 Tax=Dysosmobacter sp. TaxID=2591382 RepID=UPI003D8E28E1
MNSIIFLFVILFALITIGVPVGFAIAGATISTIAMFSGLDMIMMAQYSYTGTDSFPIMAIPFFMLAGAIMSTGGIAKRIVEVANNAVGFLTGGLGAVVSLASMFFAAISGSAMATVSSIGGMLIPEMKNKKYPLEYSACLASFAGTIGIIIPPSIPLVIYGIATQTSISDLFLAGVFPGILIGLALIITNWLLCKKYGFGERQTLGEGFTIGQWAARLGKSFINGLWALMSPVIILGGIYSGIFTPTEASVVAVVYSFVVSKFVYKELTWKGLLDCLLDTGKLNGITTYLLGFSGAFAAYLSLERVPNAVFEFLASVTDNKIVLLLIINVFLLILGCFMDNIPATIILAPILLPAVMGFGVDPIHFGIIMTLNLAIGLVTPPYGCNLFVGAAVAHIKMDSMFKYLLPFMIPMLLVLGLVTYVEAITMFAFY